MRYLSILFRASLFYVILRILIWLAMYNNVDIASSINYDHADSYFWYLLWFGIPILTSILIAWKLHIKFLNKLGLVFFPLLLIGTLVGGYINFEYWGYFFKRPAVFSELKNCKEIQSIDFIERAPKTSELVIEKKEVHSDLFSSREDPYYADYDRALMTFIDYSKYLSQIDENGDKWYTHSNARDWHKILNDSSKTISQDLLHQIQPILTSDQYHDYSWTPYNGQVVVFRNTNNIEYCHVSLESWEVENDHYFVWEILIDTSRPSEIVKSQVYFYDFAGIEGLEYCNVAPMGEAFVLITSIAIVLLMNTFVFLKKWWRG